MVACYDTFLVIDSPNDFVGVISLLMLYAHCFTTSHLKCILAPFHK